MKACYTGGCFFPISPIFFISYIFFICRPINLVFELQNLLYSYKKITKQAGIPELNSRCHVYIVYYIYLHLKHGKNVLTFNGMKCHQLVTPLFELHQKSTGLFRKSSSLCQWLQRTQSLNFSNVIIFTLELLKNQSNGNK